MIRLAFLAILVYLLFRLIRNVFSLSGRNQQGRFRTTPSGNRIKDEMVQDPQCKVYIPKGESFPKVINGERLYFCSKECMEEYIKARKGQNRGNT